MRKKFKVILSAAIMTTLITECTKILDFQCQDAADKKSCSETAIGRILLHLLLNVPLTWEKERKSGVLKKRKSIIF
jgi:hypothetical protein